MQLFYKLPLSIQATIVGLTLTTLSYGIAFYAGWLTEPNTLEIAAVLTSFSCTYLCVMQSRWNYPLGVVTTLLYAILFYQWGLFGSAVVNLYLMVQLAYGWFRWGPDKNTRAVTKMTIDEWGFWIAIALVTWAIGVVILFSLGATFSFTDAGIMVLTILAQWLLDNKKLENWYVWVLVNVLAIATYFYAGLYLAGLQYIFFLGNTVYGWYMWRKTMNPSTVDHKIDWEDGVSKPMEKF
jgi:nicotinamide mononucleotide transporter